MTNEAELEERLKAARKKGLRRLAEDLAEQIRTERKARKKDDLIEGKASAVKTLLSRARKRRQ